MTSDISCIVRGCKKPRYRSSIHNSVYCAKHLDRDFPKLSRRESLKQADEFYRKHQPT